MTYAFLIAVADEERCQQNKYHKIKNIQSNIITFDDNFPNIEVDKITLQNGLSIGEILCRRTTPNKNYYFKALLHENFDEKEISFTKLDYFIPTRIPIINGAFMEFQQMSTKEIKLVPLTDIYLAELNPIEKKIKPLKKLLKLSDVCLQLAEFSIISFYLAKAHQRRIHEREMKYRKNQLKNNFDIGVLTFECNKSKYKKIIPLNYIIPWCSESSTLIKSNFYQYDFITIEQQNYWEFFWQIIITQEFPNLKNLIIYFKISDQLDIIQIIDFTIILIL